ncbi:MAG: hypothetical protein GDA56_29965 [Hormoscilla sp. GM7CHS1pb]|nr:hypothetical protein [Hormoscilla sp. GM7CHS1pb]
MVSAIMVLKIVTSSPGEAIGSSMPRESRCSIAPSGGRSDRTTREASNFYHYHIILSSLRSHEALKPGFCQNRVSKAIAFSVKG